MRLHVAELDHERVRPAVDAAAAEEPGHHHRVRGHGPQAPGPPLGRGQRRGVQHEPVVAGVEGGRGLEASDESSVPELGLRIRSDDPEGERVREELGLLLRVGLRQEGRDEHLEEKEEGEGSMTVFVSRRESERKMFFFFF